MRTILFNFLLIISLISSCKTENGENNLPSDFDNQEINNLDLEAEESLNPEILIYIINDSLLIFNKTDTIPIDDLSDRLNNTFFQQDIPCRLIIDKNVKMGTVSKVKNILKEFSLTNGV